MLLISLTFHELLLAMAALLNTLWKDFMPSTAIEMVSDLRHGACAEARARRRGTIHAMMFVDNTIDFFALVGFVKVLCVNKDSLA
jgi:hypothetical protein